MTEILNRKTEPFNALSAVLLLAVIIPSIPFASAQETTCTGPLGPGTYENIQAPGPGYCFLDNVTVNGDITHTGGALILENSNVSGNIQSDGGSTVFLHSTTVNGSIQSTSAFFSLSSSTIEGSVQSENSQGVWIVSSTVNGNVQVNNFAQSSPTDSVDILSSTIVGNVQIDAGTLGLVRIGDQFGAGNTITGDIKISDNTLTWGVNSAEFSIVDNTVGGNIQCTGNSSTFGASNLGVPNTVSGNTKGECKGLEL